MATTTSDGPPSPSVSVSVSSTLPPGACPPAAPSFSSTEIRSALESAPLPVGVVLVSQNESADIDDQSLLDVRVMICQSGLVGAPLKGVATTLAQSLQSSDVSARIGFLLVGNVAEDAHPEGEVRLDDFQLYASSSEAEILGGWKYAAEN